MNAWVHATWLKSAEQILEPSRCFTVEKCTIQAAFFPLRILLFQDKTENVVSCTSQYAASIIQQHSTWKQSKNVFLRYMQGKKFVGRKKLQASEHGHEHLVTWVTWVFSVNCFSAVAR